MVEIDLGHHIKIHSPVCGRCRHWRVLEGRTCAAFPKTDSIPLEIWQGKNGHTRPYPADHGIRFEPMGLEDRARRKKELEIALARAKAADEELMNSILE